MNLFFQFLSLLGFGFACWAVGDFFQKALLKQSASLPAVGRCTLSFTAGNVALSYLLTALGFAGCFLSPVFWLVLLGGAGMAVWRVVEVGRSSLGLKPARIHVHDSQDVRLFVGGGPKDRAQEGWAFLFLAVVAGFFFLPAIIQSAAPPYVRDSLVYHLLCPREYLKAGRLLHIEGNLYSAFPKGQEVLMTLLLGVAGDRAAQGFSLLQQLAMVGAVYSATRLMVGPWAAAFCAIGCATVPPAIYFAGCGYVEPALLMSLGASLLTLTLLLRSRAERSAEEGISLKGSAFLGFLAGWMPALKYTGLIYLGLIGFLLLWNQKRAPATKALRSGMAYSIAALPGLCWMIWNWSTLGNPVFPMAWSFFGGVGWDPARARAMDIYFNLFGMGRDFLDYLLLPWRLAFSGRFDSVRFDGAIGPFLLIFLIGAAIAPLISGKYRGIKAPFKGMGFAILASAAFFVLGTQQARFWMPTQVLICIASAPAIEHLVRLARKDGAVKVVVGAIVAASLIWNVAFLGKQFFKVAYYKPALNMEEKKVFLSGKIPGYPAMEFMNSHLPEHSRSLLVWTGVYGYYLSRSYYSDTFLEDVTLKRLIDSSGNGKELSLRLTEAGFSHLYVQLSLLEKNMDPSQRNIFGDFRAKEAEELFRFKDYAVLAVPRY